MKRELLGFCAEKGILLDKKILEVFEKIGDIDIAKNLIERVNYQYNQKIITTSFFVDNKEKVSELISNYSKSHQKIIEAFFINLGVNVVNLNINICISRTGERQKKKEPDVLLKRVYENLPKKIEVKDFVKNFKNRFNSIKNIMQERAILENMISINRIEHGKQCSLIALIYNKKATKNGNILLEIEDLSGRTTALINKNRTDVFEKSKELLLDEVVALKCSGNRDMVFVNDIIFPDARALEIKKSKVDESIAFISDLHIGSNKFLEEHLMRFIIWLNGDAGSDEQKREALKIKYLLITGDSIDGVGIYPGQENELILKDVREQYKKLADILSKIRKDVSIVLCPGQHDSVRVAEPQPIITENYGAPLYLLDNLCLATNPALVELGKDVKFKVLMYHGASMHGIINSIESLRLGRGHDSPTEVVKHMLRKRHLAPTHSLVTYTPLEGEDALLIKEVPDIVSTGDLHRPEVSNYNGIVLIASSCWQSRTPFEEKVGNNPDPCKVPVFNMKTREIKILDFSEGLDKFGNIIKGDGKKNKDVENE